MSEYPLARPMTRILNEARRLPHVDWESFQDAVQEALAYTDVLQNRITAGFPLLAAIPEAQDVQVQFDTAVSSQKAMLGQLAEGASRRDANALGVAMPQMEMAAYRLSEVVFGLKRFEDRMPQFSDIPLVNEILTLALHQLQKKGDFAQDLMQRLPRLREFIAYLESVLSGFAVRHPQRTDLIESFEVAVQGLKQSAGGMFLYLQETHSIVDLSNAVTLFDRSVQWLGAVFHAMREVEYRALEFSEDPVLDRLARAIEGLQAGEDVRDEIARTRAGLVRSHRQLASDLAVLDARAFMPLSVREEYVPKLVDLLNRMDAEMALLHDPTQPPLALAEAVNRYQALGARYDELQGELEDRLAARPDLSESPHYDHLVVLMQGVYEGSIPDANLEAKLGVILALQEGLRRRLALEVRRQPDEAARLQEVLDALEVQRTALAMVEEYLASGERDLLLQAYETLLPPTVKLIEFKREATRVEGESRTPTILCPFCSTPNEPGTARCSQCMRPLPSAALGVAPSTEMLDLYDSGASGGTAQEGLSENFQYLVDVIDDTVSGVIDPSEARDLLASFWETVVAAEMRARDTLRASAMASGDPMVASYQEELQALLAYLREVLGSVFEALDAGDTGSLTALRVQVMDCADSLQRFHAEVQEASRG